MQGDDNRNPHPLQMEGGYAKVHAENESKREFKIVEDDDKAEKEAKKQQAKISNKRLWCMVIVPITLLLIIMAAGIAWIYY